mmetsp:Transcript_42324/g.88827  ORF Transcript_42324/g.88827 Transcript_42324/m.88827 type:complete len:374 (+) Transcript_42324:219-1340(+)
MQRNFGKMNAMPMPQQIVVIASTFHKLSILLFGYFIPALSSVKAVVRKDAEGYHQWTTYWLILHLYITILSPLLHLTLHPIFQIIAVLWLSLPQYQGASVVYERLVNPWVDQYESRVDEAVDEAHRGARRWVWSKMGGVIWLLVGEGGSLAEGLLTVVMGFLGVNNAKLQPERSEEVLAVQSSTSSESLLQPRHSIKEALSQSSFEEAESSVDDIRTTASFDPTDEFVNDFVSMLQQGLYAFASVEMSSDAINRTDGTKRHVFEDGFKLGTFSYTKDEGGAFLISPVVAGAHEMGVSSSQPVALPLDTLTPLRQTGTQGLIIECHNITNRSDGNTTSNVRAELVLSDETDRNILLNGLTACLPSMIPSSVKNQ